MKRYIGSVRTALGRELLRDPPLKVGEAGRRGYGRSRGLLRFFKEQVGMRPQKYRATLARE